MKRDIGDDEIFKKALAKWGRESQIGMVYEECGELITALNQFHRGRIGLAEVIDEVADVTIMIKQLSYILGYERVNDRVAFKMTVLCDKVNTK
jgi:NTP pyrophosphatase (non-canonical NTP hydrolase)